VKRLLAGCSFVINEESEQLLVITTHTPRPPPPGAQQTSMSVGERQGTGAAAHDEEDSQEDGCGRGDNPARLRWAVNIAKWDPEGNHEGEEFQFLLSLLPDNERKDCLKMMFMPDKKRAIVSRLLQRAACARVTGTLHAHVHINRTKGRKPFLSFITTGTGDFSSSQPARLLHAPNFNFNVSHEGDFVVLASEPSAICGVDVAAPGQARRRGKDGRMPTAEEMLNTFSDVFTPHEKEQIRAAGKNSAGNNTSAEEEDDAKEEVFRRHWSLKESLVKAMGVGLQLELGRAEFHTGGVVGGGEGGGMGGGGGGVGKGGGGLSRRSPDSSDGDDNDPGSPKRDPRRDNPAANFLLFSPSCKRIFVSDGGGDGPSVGGGNGMETARLILDGRVVSQLFTTLFLRLSKH
jgi:4'-phosphopantetheinyl transferase